MADKRNLDSCTIVDVSSQSEKGKDYTKRKIKTRERRRKENIFNWILDSPCFLLEKVMFIGNSKL